jgi:hypothetical protein
MSVISNFAKIFAARGTLRVSFRWENLLFSIGRRRWQRWQLAAGIGDTNGKFAASVTAIHVNLGKDVNAGVVYISCKYEKNLKLKI